jgi:O-acetylhomoserine (thiol)-lyase
MPDAERTPGFATLSIHAGAKPDPTTGARATPIYQTTSFVFDDVDHAAALFGLQTFGNIYTRIGNPTCAVLEERVAALEGGTAGLAIASGHAAQVVIMHALMTPGDELVASKKLYGGSINQFNHSYKNFGWNVVWADPDDLGSFENAVTPKTKCIFIESIANPGGIIIDIEAIAKLRERRACHWWSITPSQRPICANRSTMAPTLSCIRSRSFWAVTAIRSAD